MGPCLSMASLSRLTSSISLVYHLDEKVRPWVWAARSSFTRCCKATSPGSSGTAMVSSLQLLYWSEWENCNANKGRLHLFFFITPLRCSVVSLQMATHELEWRQSHADAQSPQQRGRRPLHPACHHQVWIRDLLSLRLCQRCDSAHALDFKSTLCPVKVPQLSPWTWVSGLK